MSPPRLNRSPLSPHTHSPPLKESAALDHVVGFTVANDVSARDWQMKRNGRQWLLGKTFDTFCPLGPALVTKEAVAGEDRDGTRTGMGQGTGWGALSRLTQEAGAQFAQKHPCFPPRRGGEGPTALSPSPV